MFIFQNMIMKVKEIIANIVAVIIIVMFFITMFVFILFYCANSATALKDSLTTLGSFFGGIATLTTAYVACLLFNDWRDEKRYLIEVGFTENAISAIELIEDKLFVFHTSKIEDLSMVKKNFYYLYKLVTSRDWRTTSVEKYKTYHLEAARIIMDLTIKGENELNEDERKVILKYRGVLSSVKDELVELKLTLLKD